MKAFVVSASPEPQSFTASMARTSCEILRSEGHEVKHSDLYAMNWNPVASAADFLERQNPDYLTYALEQRHGVKNGTIARDIQCELEKLVACDLLVLNFPIYWFAMPAILKGWVDRVLLSGLCYGGKRFYDQGGLVGKRALVAPTIGGQPHMFGPDAIHGPIETMLAPLLRGTLAYTGFEVVEPFIGWHVPYISQQDREAMMEDYEQYLRAIDQQPVLKYPSMSEFHPSLHPIEIKRSDA